MIFSIHLDGNLLINGNLYSGFGILALHPSAKGLAIPIYGFINNHGDLPYSHAKSYVFIMMGRLVMCDARG